VRGSTARSRDDGRSGASIEDVNARLEAFFAEWGKRRT
jgi:hypothetical protein